MNANLLAALHTYEIAIIVAVAAVFVGVIIAALVFVRRRRKNASEPLLESRDALKENLHAVQELRGMAANGEARSALDGLYGALLNLTPTSDEEAAVLDGKIRDGLADLKAHIGGGEEEVMSRIRDVGTFISERAKFTDD